MLPFMHSARHAYRLIPEGKRLPFSYFLRACDLIISRQTLCVLHGVTFPPSHSAPPFSVKTTVAGGDTRRTTAYFNSTRPRPGQRHGFCAACGRHAYISGPPAPVFCSPLCQLANYHFVCDLRALNYLRPLHWHNANAHPSVRAQLRLVPPNLIDWETRITRLLHWDTLDGSILNGRFADKVGLHFASLLYIHPVSLRRALKNHMTDNPMPPTASPSLDHPSPSTSPAPATPAPVPATPPPQDLIAINSIMNPVMRRTAEVVLSHLETANDFLSTTKKPKTPTSAIPHEGVIWNRDQVTLFLGLLNRTIPALSASMNLDAAPLTKDPAEMTREELEAAAQKARHINGTASHSLGNTAAPKQGDSK